MLKCHSLSSIRVLILSKVYFSPCKTSVYQLYWYTVCMCVCVRVRVNVDLLYNFHNSATEILNTLIKYKQYISRCIFNTHLFLSSY